jgi:hypothetical protein
MRSELGRTSFRESAVECGAAWRFKHLRLSACPRSESRLQPTSSEITVHEHMDQFPPSGWSSHLMRVDNVLNQKSKEFPRQYVGTSHYSSECSHFLTSNVRICPLLRPLSIRHRLRAPYFRRKRNYEDMLRWKDSGARSLPVLEWCSV